MEFVGCERRRGSTYADAVLEESIGWVCDSPHKRLLVDEVVVLPAEMSVIDLTAEDCACARWV